MLAALRAALVASSLGCALTPGIPAGPLRGPGIRAGLAYSYAYGRASASSVQPSGEPHVLRGNGAMFRGVIPFMPVRAMLRASPWRFMDAGADFGWTDAALQLRAGQLDARRRWPWAVELEGRTGRFSPFREPVLRQTGVVRARAELYPALGRTGEMDGFGVLTLGASTGTHFYYLFVPSRVADVNEGPIAAALMVGRVETRLEASLGVHARVPRAAFTIALQPWLTLDAARIDTWECGGCSLQFERLSAPWGFALVASGSLVFDRE